MIAYNQEKRERALKNYLKINPKCLWCLVKIPPPETRLNGRCGSMSQAAKRKFCNSSCKAKYYWKDYERKLNTKNSIIKNRKSKVSERSKAETSRSSIAMHACIVFKIKMRGRKIECEHCFIAKRHLIDVCHIKPVKNFLSTAMVYEINNPNNLIGLCKNCHWEFDHLL